MKTIILIILCIICFVIVCGFLFIGWVFSPEKEDYIKPNIDYSKPTQKPTYKADIFYNDFKGFENLIEYSEIIDKINTFDPEVESKETIKKDNLKKSWIRWEQIFEFSDSSKVKLIRKLDNNLYILTKIEKCN